MVFKLWINLRQNNIVSKSSFSQSALRKAAERGCDVKNKIDSSRWIGKKYTNSSWTLQGRKSRSGRRGWKRFRRRRRRNGKGEVFHLRKMKMVGQGSNQCRWYCEGVVVVFLLLVVLMVGILVIRQVVVVSLGWCELADEDLTPENSSKAVNRFFPIKPSAFLWLNVLSWLASVPKSLTKFNLSPTPTPPTATTTPTTPWWWWSPGASWTCQAKSGKEERWLGFGATENNSSFRFLITHRHIYHVHDGDDGDEDDNNIIIMILDENPRPTKRSWTRVRWSWLKPRLGKHSTARCADWSQEQHLR